MDVFKEVKANRKSLSGRKLILGYGTNDADYKVQPVVDGKQLSCPYYAKWHSMIKRCYSEKYHAKFPTYIGCVVIEEWLTFSNFKSWMVKQDWENKHLDKDLLFKGNKVYSKEKCLFVTREINLLLHDHKSKRGLYPQGVHLSKRDKKFVAQTSINRKRKHIGYFGTVGEAYSAYKLAKYEHITEIALKQTEPLKSALLRYRVGFT